MINRPPHYMPGAEPIFHRGSSDIGCLLLHGITASPAELSWLAQDLAARDFTVYVPRMAGHGSDYRLLRGVGWRDWYLTGADGLHLLRAQCRRVVVIGHSMGGLVGSLLAANAPVDGLILLAAPFSLPKTEPSLRAARWLQLVRPFLYLGDTSNLPMTIRQEQLRRGEPYRGRVRYERWATRALHELYLLMVQARRALPQITTPTLLMYSEADETVPFFNQNYAAGKIGSKQVELAVLKTSSHILPQDVERETVFEMIAEFIERLKTMG
ncbi:MAG: alpha/beta fold hydrolase [bacterium]|nr:alpha/beta fold hydrolase [bacterium]